MAIGVVIVPEAGRASTGDGLPDLELDGAEGLEDDSVRLLIWVG